MYNLYLILLLLLPPQLEEEGNKLTTLGILYELLLGDLSITIHIDGSHHLLQDVC